MSYLNNESAMVERKEAEAMVEEAFLNVLSEKGKLKELENILRVGDGKLIKAISHEDRKKAIINIGSDIYGRLASAKKNLDNIDAAFAKGTIDECDSLLASYHEAALNCINTVNPKPNFMPETEYLKQEVGFIGSIPSGVVPQFIMQKPYNNSDFNNQPTDFVDVTVKQMNDIPNNNADVVKNKKSSKPNAVRISDQLLEKYKFALYKDSVYIYCISYFRFFSEADMCRIIKAEFKKEAEASGTNNFLKEVYNFIFHESTIQKFDKSFEEISHLIAFTNGFLDTTTTIFYPPDPRYFFTHCININYDDRNTGDCYNFKQFIKTIAAGNDLLIRRIWEILGYIFSNDMRGKVFFLFQGISNSGKSTLGEVISSFFPEEAQTSLCINELANNFALGNLQGKAICTDLDLPAGKIGDKDLGKLKSITGNDVITADVKFKDRVKFKNRAKLLFATNHAFETNREDIGFLNRLVVVPFKVSIRREQCNYNLIKSFEGERLAIVKVAIEHYRQLVYNNYIFSGDFEVNEDVISYTGKEVSNDLHIVTNEQEQIENFVKNCCEITSDHRHSFTVDLYRAYGAFYENEPISLLDLKVFSEILYKTYKDFVERIRIRRPGQKNPESCFVGLILKEN